MTLRRLRVLVEHLPPDSATARAVHGTHWQDREFLAADAADSLRALFTAFCNANRGGSTAAMPWPEPLPRPGDPEPPSEDDKRTAARAAYEHITSRTLPTTRR